MAPNTSKNVNNKNIVITCARSCISSPPPKKNKRYLLDTCAGITIANKDVVDNIHTSTQPVTVEVARFEPTNAAKGLVGTCGRTRIDIGSGGTHCTPKADIGIQGLKRIARYINSGLPWTCPMTWVPHLVTAAKVLKAARASSVNRHPLPPVTVLTGKKLTAADFLFAFGDYVEADAPSPVSNDAQKDRSVGAIVLYQNINGTWECMNLATKMLLPREASQLTLMPTTQAVIDRVNEIAAADKKKCKKTPRPSPNH